MGHCFQTLPGLPGQAAEAGLPPVSVSVSWGMGWVELLSDSKTQLLSWPCPWPQSHKLWKYPLSPPPHSPNPQSHAWAASPFLLLHSKAGAGEGTLWSRAEEGGSRGAACRHTPCLQAVGGGDLQALLPGSQAARGALEILPTPPTAASCPTWLPARNRAWHSPTRLCVPEIKNTLLTPKLVPGWSVLSRSWWPQKGWCHFPAGETDV